MATDAILSVRDLSVAYGQTRILDGISLDLEQGEFLALLGRSGCGKTTLLRTIGGFMRPEHGQVRIDGVDVTRLSPEARPTAMVFQSYALWPHMTVFGNIAYGLKLRGVPKPEITRRIDEVLALLRLDGLADRKVTALSGGQRQRVALGRALAVAPRLLLLDEPLSNLDARIRLDLRHEIRDLLKRLGVTAVHVTHDREEAMVMADRLALMNGGQIVQQGAPAELYDRPASSFVADFMGASNIITLDVRHADDGLIVEGPGIAPARISAAAGACTFSDNCARADIHFRSAQARIEASGAVVGDELSLPGVILQATYPGDSYRYAVQVGHDRFLVDDIRKFSEGEAVRIVLPAGAIHLFPHVDAQSAA